MRLTEQELAEIRRFTSSIPMGSGDAPPWASMMIANATDLLLELDATRLDVVKAWKGIQDMAAERNAETRKLEAAQQQLADMARADENGKPCDDCQTVHCPTTWATKQLADLTARCARVEAERGQARRVARRLSEEGCCLAQRGRGLCPSCMAIEAWPKPAPECSETDSGSLQPVGSKR